MGGGARMYSTVYGLFFEGVQAGDENRCTTPRKHTYQTYRSYALSYSLEFVIRKCDPWAKAKGCDMAKLWI